MAAATDAPSKKRDASAMDAGYQRIAEGSASMNYELRGADTRNRGTADHDGPVFYNKVQVFNRDLSVVANDVDADAAAACGRNAAENGAADICEAHCGDAVDFMTAAGKGSQGFDAIDLDPYGSCAPFLDAAVQAVNDGGLLCVTSTDMTVLSGNYPEVCFAKYGSMPTKAKHLHEFALRILVHAIEAAAAKYQRHVVPVLSLSIDFYVRVFVRVYKRPAEVKKSAAKRASTRRSASPRERRREKKRGGRRRSSEAAPGGGAAHGGGGPGRPEAALDETVAPAFCGETGAPFKIGGPIWSAPLHDPRIHGMLTAVSEELLDVPLYYTLPDLCSALHCASPKMAEVRAALTHAGYRVSQHHREPDAIKTDAPPRVLWDVFRCWVKKHPPQGPPLGAEPGGALGPKAAARPQAAQAAK
ncbi:N(2),N(2)-dimethylguanosine tRNA methyltransferase [Aureococcus anophagefferens]|nr:N(2),N(2)-dimethylguanosine tRNA methyltransferase [Aureococcus anophagefferens]